MSNPRPFARPRTSSMRRRQRQRQQRRLLVENLEARQLMAVLTSGTGEGHLTVSVNEYGAFGRSGSLEVSQPFKTQAGWHIVQRIGTRQVNATDENRRAQLRDTIGQRPKRRAHCSPCPCALNATSVGSASPSFGNRANAASSGTSQCHPLTMRACPT